jgi:hypothetical protein
LGTSAAELPRLDAYLSGLAGRLDAHPECVAKGALVRNLLDAQPAEGLLRSLPSPLVRLVTDPPIGSDWVPEAHLVALYLAVADVRGLRDEDFLAFARERNRVLFRSPAYRFLMEVLSPATLLRFAGPRWSNFHRGTTLDVDGVSDDGVRFTLRFPPKLIPPLMIRVYAQAFLAALELARARFPDVRVEAEAESSARFLAVWS